MLQDSVRSKRSDVVVFADEDPEVLVDSTSLWGKGKRVGFSKHRSGRGLGGRHFLITMQVSDVMPRNSRLAPEC